MTWGKSITYPCLRLLHQSKEKQKERWWKECPVQFQYMRGRVSSPQRCFLPIQWLYIPPMFPSDWINLSMIIRWGRIDDWNGRVRMQYEVFSWEQHISSHRQAMVHVGLLLNRSRIRGVDEDRSIWKCRGAVCSLWQHVMVHADVELHELLCQYGRRCGHTLGGWRREFLSITWFSYWEFLFGIKHRFSHGMVLIQHRRWRQVHWQRRRLGSKHKVCHDGGFTNTQLVRAFSAAYVLLQFEETQHANLLPVVNWWVEPSIPWWIQWRFTIAVQEIQHLAIGCTMFFIVMVHSYEMLQQVVKAKVEWMTDPLQQNAIDDDEVIQDAISTKVWW